MERIENISEVSKEVLVEHKHRYQWACEAVRGLTLDVACGIGYASEILLQNKELQVYFGVDLSQKAIDYAGKNYSNKKAFFCTCDVLSLGFCERSFDTVISFETLEHLKEPEKALSEFKRVLKPNGIFIGSAPAEELDDVTEEVYGKNLFHLTRFNLEKLKSLLSKYFCFFEIYLSCMDIGTRFTKIYSNLDAGIDSCFSEHGNDNPLIYSSYIFVASDISFEYLFKNRHIGSKYSYMYGMSFFELLHKKDKSLKQSYQDYLKIKSLYDDSCNFYRQLKGEYDNLYKDYLAINDTYKKLQESNAAILENYTNLQQENNEFSRKLDDFKGEYDILNEKYNEIEQSKAVKLAKKIKKYPFLIKVLSFLFDFSSGIFRLFR